MQPITAIIVVKGNPKHLFASLNSIHDFVSEILIIDIGIDESIKKRLKEYPIQVINVQEIVPYVELIREKIKQFAKQPFVLFLDPDEIVTDALREEWILAIRKYDYIETPRKNIMMGRWICHSRWWPDYQTRLFKKDKVIWPKEIHKQPVTKGFGYKIEPKEELAIVHYNYETIDEYFSKMTRYAKAEAGSKEYKDSKPQLTSVLNASITEFISRYFASEGYRDGIHGFMLSFFQMLYPFLVYFYYFESIGFKNSPPDKELVRSSTFFFGRLYKEVLFWKAQKNNATLKERIVEKII